MCKNYVLMTHSTIHKFHIWNSAVFGKWLLKLHVYIIYRYICLPAPHVAPYQGLVMWHYTAGRPKGAWASLSMLSRGESGACLVRECGIFHCGHTGAKPSYLYVWVWVYACVHACVCVFVHACKVHLCVWALQTQIHFHKTTFFI